jgi:hypothetical protein
VTILPHAAASAGSFQKQLVVKDVIQDVAAHAVSAEDALHSVPAAIALAQNEPPNSLRNVAAQPAVRLSSQPVVDWSRKRKQNVQPASTPVQFEHLRREPVRLREQSFVPKRFVEAGRAPSPSACRDGEYRAGST